MSSYLGFAISASCFSKLAQTNERTWVSSTIFHLKGKKLHAAVHLDCFTWVIEVDELGSFPGVYEPGCFLAASS